MFHLIWHHMIVNRFLLAASNKLLYVMIIILQYKDRFIPNSIPTTLNDLGVERAIVCYVAQEKISLF
jgi:hypothetical protein